MSFAKLAADSLLSPEEEADRQAKRARWGHLLTTLGVLGAGGAAAYYFGKNNGANAQAVGEKMHLLSPDPAAPPAGATNDWINNALRRTYIPDSIRKHVGIDGAGAVGGAWFGAKAPSAFANQTLGRISANANTVDHSTFNNMKALNERVEKSGVGTPGAFQKMLATGNQSLRPDLDPATAQARFGKTRSITDVPDTQLLAAIGGKTRVRPLTINGSPINPWTSWKARRDLANVVKGLGVISNAQPGQQYRPPSVGTNWKRLGIPQSGTIQVGQPNTPRDLDLARLNGLVDLSQLNAHFQRNTGLVPNEAANFLNEQRGTARPSLETFKAKAIGTGVGAIGGAWTADRLRNSLDERFGPAHIEANDPQFTPGTVGNQ